jgi:hypothetical protein
MNLQDIKQQVHGMQDNAIYLHVAQVNGVTRIVDQDGRILEGVIEFDLNAKAKGITTVTAKFEVMSIKDGDKLYINTGA